MNITPTKPRGIYLLPNLFTIASIFSGFYSLVASWKGNYEYAALAIFIAAIMDALDGRIARLTNTMTAFGAQFDSMADMVSFGAAPALLAYTWGLQQLAKPGWIIAFFYTVAVALRLARFNTQADGSGKKYFQGLPCPTAAITTSGLIWIYTDLNYNNFTLIVILALLMMVTALLMVSNIRYRSFKDISLKKHVKFIMILTMVFILTLISIAPEKVIFTILLAYTLSGPITTIGGLRKRRLLRKNRRQRAG